MAAAAAAAAAAMQANLCSRAQYTAQRKWSRRRV